MTPKLKYLAWGVVLLLGHVAVQATISDLRKVPDWALSALEFHQIYTSNPMRTSRIEDLAEISQVVLATSSPSWHFI